MAERKRTARGFAIYGEIPVREGTVRVQESSLAFEGAHVWLFIDGAECKDHMGKHLMPYPHLSVAQSKTLIAALQDFVDDAEGDALTEPADRRRG